MSYLEASTIFFQLCPNKILAGHLFKSDKPANQEKLLYEVKKLLDKHKIDWRKSKAPSQPIKELKGTPNELRGTAPISFSFQPLFSTEKATYNDSPLKERVLNERKALYLQRGHLHGRLHEVTTDEARFNLARDLYIIQQKIDEYNRDLREVENGNIPTRYLATTATGAEVLRRRNVKIYIARINKKLPGIVDEKERQKLLKQLQNFENELANL
jgi:hypothetical protein